MSAPLRDESDGKLKAWPGGGVHYPGGHYEPIFRHATAGEAAVAIVAVPTDLPEYVYCKYCYQTRHPLVLREYIVEPSEMVICSECAYGLAPPARTAVESLKQAPWIEVDR